MCNPSESSACFGDLKDTSVLRHSLSFSFSSLCLLNHIQVLPYALAWSVRALVISMIPIQRNEAN